MSTPSSVGSSSSSSGDEISLSSSISVQLRISPAVEAVATKHLKKGTIVESSLSRRRYEVIENLKRGNLCVIVKLQERNTPTYQKQKTFVLKAECGPVMDEETGLRSELNILAKAAEARRLRPAMVDSFVELVDRGITDHFRFIIVTALGNNLVDLQKNYKSFPLSTAVRINKRMLNAIRNLHNLGFIHRNIQPSNFAIGAQTQAAVVFLIGFSLATRCDVDPVTGYEKDASRPHHRRINTLSSVYMSRNAHFTMNLSRLDDIESWLYSCLSMCFVDALPWKKCYIPSEALEVKKNFFYHLYTFELFHERIPVEYRRIIDIINSAIPRSTPNYSSISEVNDKLCKLHPSKKKATSVDMTRSLMLPTISLPTTNTATVSSRDASTNSFYGTPPSQDVFPWKGKPKDASPSKAKSSKAKTPSPAPVTTSASPIPAKTPPFASSPSPAAAILTSKPLPSPATTTPASKPTPSPKNASPKKDSKKKALGVK